MVEYANFLSTLFMRGQPETLNLKPETRNPVPSINQNGF